MHRPGGRSPVKLTELRHSQVVCAVLLLLAVNFGLSAFHPIKTPAPQNLTTNHTWEWWRTREFIAQTAAPNVVLMGSSLMMIPTNLYEADYLNQNVDVAVHCRSKYLENLLGAAIAPRVTCFNFALPGSMISDDYMVERALMQGERKPRVIVVGLTLRDLIDSHCPCAASTSAFQFFQRFTPVDDLMAIATPEWWQRLAYLPATWLYVSGKKLELQAALGDLVARMVAPLASPRVMQCPSDKVAQGNGVAAKLSRAESRAFVLRPHEPWSFEDNTNEYRKRFGSGNEKQFECQVAFLHRFLADAQAENIRVLVVNMPLTQANIKLMPTGYYEKYLAVTASACTEYGANWLDLNRRGGFPADDFRDTAHMNSAGGKRLLDSIAAAMLSDTHFSTALLQKNVSSAGKLAGLSAAQ